MSIFVLLNGDKVATTAHLDEKLVERKISLAEVKETIDSPDTVTGDKHDPDGKKYWKNYGRRTLVVCLNHSRSVAIGKTIFVYNHND